MQCVAGTPRRGAHVANRHPAELVGWGLGRDGNVAKKAKLMGQFVD